MEEKSILTIVQSFAESVKEKTSQLAAGEPEEQLRAPFEALMREIGQTLQMEVVCIGESRLPERLGKPDYAVHSQGLLEGYVELKSPGAGANPERFRGRNREQWKRFKAIPNLIYSDGNEWALYREGRRAGKMVRFSGDIAVKGGKVVTLENARALQDLLRDFLSWEPFIPLDRRGKIELRSFAAMLAPLCRLLREDVTDTLKDPHSPLVQLAKEWRQLLFPDASDKQFADAYAQTVAFALLLGRSEGADPLTLNSAEVALASQHSLLSRALQMLTDPIAQAEISASLDLLLRVIAIIPPITLVEPQDPWLYFYEDFLAVYDPKLRKDAGVYYTPIEVVRAQVRLIDNLLVNRLGKPLGFSDPEVVTLDPAAGTGTYLLGVIDHALRRVETEQGIGAVPGQATTLANNLFGFELMVGPYAVTELRISRALRDRGAVLPKEGANIYLTDTLESPYTEPPQLPLFHKPIADQHIKALNVKSKVSVIVCLGNPPYDRHEAVNSNNRARTGGWVRWGDDSENESAIFHDFVDPVVKAGHGVHLKWLYNSYTYFWRWALWKVFEHETSQGSGVVSFISASSYLWGDAFAGMRELMRHLCDDIWILDLGGEGRGGRKDENIFAIQTPVTIAITVRSEKVDINKPANVHYYRIMGSRKEKLKALDLIDDFNSVEWQECPSQWSASFLPGGEGDYFRWPLIFDLFPWQHSGSQFFRNWPIAPDKETLRMRWQALLRADDRAKVFRESRDRKINRTYLPLFEDQQTDEPIADLLPSSPPPPIVRYGFRSLDRQYTFFDSRIGDVMKPVLWNSIGEPRHSRQLFITTQRGQVLGNGPTLMATHTVPDFNFFCGRAGGAIPLYRLSDASEANILPDLLELLDKVFKSVLAPENFLAYVYGLLAQPAFTERFTKELETRELRVPITKNAKLFKKVSDLGTRLLWLHTYGERFVPEGKRRGQVPTGLAKCRKAIPSDPENYPETFTYAPATQTLHVGRGEFAPVSPEVFTFEVSGLKVVQSWLKYRIKKGAGKKSSPLDDIRPEHWTSQFTTELLELLWVLEATLECYPEQAKLLEAVVAGPCFQADELPEVPKEMRKPPAPRSANCDLFDGLYDE